MRENGSATKRPLRAVLRRYVPEELFDKPKQGFEPPLGDWLRGPLREWAENLLSQNAMADTPYFDPAPVQAVWKEHKAGVRDWRFELWNVLMFKLGGKPGGFRCFDIRYMRGRLLGRVKNAHHRIGGEAAF